MFGQLVAEEHGDDGRRRFVGAQTVIVARGGDRDAQQILILVHRLDDGAQEQQELRVLVRGLARLEQVDARYRWKWTSCCACREPFTPANGFSCSRQARPCCLRDLFHHLHGQLVVVGGDVGGGEHGRQLVLARVRPRCARSWQRMPSFQSSSSSSCHEMQRRADLIAPK